MWRETNDSKFHCAFRVGFRVPHRLGLGLGLGLMEKPLPSAPLEVAIPPIEATKERNRTGKSRDFRSPKRPITPHSAAEGVQQATERN